MTIPASILQLIEGSGNSFHSRVAGWFHNHGWHVVVSPYYMDHLQSKSRELDLVVEKLVPITGGFRERQGDVVIRLFVECKYVASEAVFWLAPKKRDQALELVCSSSPFRKNNTYTEKHHYLATSPRVAKLFSSNNAKGAESDPFFKALNQALNATLAMRSQAPTHTEVRDRQRGTLVVLDFPVIVCNSFSAMYAVDFMADAAPVAIQDNFQLEVQYAYLDVGGRARNDYFLVDLVEFNQLTNFETALDATAGAAAFLAART